MIDQGTLSSAECFRKKEAPHVLVGIALILRFADQGIIFWGLPVQVILQWKETSLIGPQWKALL